MVVHQHIGIDRHLVLFGVFTHQFQQHLPVVIGFDDDLAVVAPLDDMVGVASDGEAGQSGHGREMKMESDPD